MTTPQHSTQAEWQTPRLVDLTTRETHSGSPSDTERIGGTTAEPIPYGPTPGGSNPTTL